MKILAVDTSSRTGSVAVLEDEAVLAEIQVTSTQTHAKRLMPAIDSALRMAGTHVSECDGFAVTTGPGSFTGLRIGISAVKGLAFATAKPVTAVSTLEALAYQFPTVADLICPLLDARKGEVYTALYRCDHYMHWEKVAPDSAVDPRPWLMQIDHPCLFVGNGVDLYRNLIKEIAGRQARFAPPYLNTVRASVAAYIGAKQIKRGQVADVGSLVPHYIRKSDAETKIEKRKVG
ncbi:MAG: tRNA (adenosine(37)-N6)-threonylcarbamoyltransferase complex dimerization subunit type 1 TsaB [Desulfobacterales bacterium]|nr:tRNA (adenosine(37)-N6)-threonylcarbamoyltransferase complex dimerization subunit type 1 TsaB [Desulfobacterales bacterium]